jgi:LruC domain-containing protein
MRLLVLSNLKCAGNRRKKLDGLTPAASTVAGIILVFGLFSQGAYAQSAIAETAFAECPAKAYLTQGKQPSTYSVNLVTGNYNVVASSHGTKSPLNGVGFNTNDQYFYGWSYEHKQPARIHNDWSIEPLLGVNTTGADYYVGDVSIVENKYYVYRRGSGNGLFSIGLDPESNDYLKMNKIIDGSNLNLKIYDMAFHPSDGFAYAVDRSGDLYKIRATDGSSENLGSVGESGIYGAAYFDVDGNLYLGRNNDGAIFKIAIDSGIYAAELFTMGPAAGTNDGSRCAIAPISDGTDILVDYGDAPDSYGTSLAKNGARHGVSENPTLYMGTTVDGESDASFYPLSDDHDFKKGKPDKKGKKDDEDGVEFVTKIVERESALVVVKSSAVGYLNAWIDFNRNGEFDTSEQILTDQVTTEGKSSYQYEVPDGVSEGKSWARFRISSTAGLPATGGTFDGEVEDHQVKIQEQDLSVTSYPSAEGWTTVAFEDSWPFFGDYDMNDLVVYLRNTVHSNSDGVFYVVIEGELAAAGASYHNGFGIRLPGVLQTEINADKIEFKVNGLDVLDISPLEANRNEAIFIIAEDIFDYVGPGDDCIYYRTEAGCGSEVEMFFSISIPFKRSVDVSLSGVFDPFMFATPGEWHGPQFSNPPGRSYEIHLKNQSPTEAFNPWLFAGIGQDASEPTNGIYFQTPQGMPWAIEVGSRWDYPLEHHEITEAYPPFINYAETNGTEDIHWYDPATADYSHIFTD